MESAGESEMGPSWALIVSYRDALVATVLGGEAPSVALETQEEGQARRAVIEVPSGQGGIMLRNRVKA